MINKTFYLKTLHICIKQLYEEKNTYSLNSFFVASLPGSGIWQKYRKLYNKLDTNLLTNQYVGNFNLSHEIYKLMNPGKKD